MDPSLDAFYRYITNNDAPSVHEASQYQTVLNVVSARNAHYRSMVHVMETQMKHLQAVLSPLRLFPAEVLGEIFVYALDVPSFLDAKGRANLLNLGLVCKKWRNATLATPVLWANVSVGDGEMDSQKLLMWFERARGAPKSLCLKPQSGSPDSDFYPGDFLEKLETSDLAGVHHVRLEAKDVNELKDMCNTWRCAAEDRVSRSVFRGGLKSFEAYFTDEITQGDGWVWEGEQYNHLPPVPSLSLRFPSEHLAFDPDPDLEALLEEGYAWLPAPEVNLDFPPSLLEALTSLNIKCNWEGNHLNNILSRCPNLETLTCTPTHDLDYTSARHHVDLPSLTTLRLRDVDSLELLSTMRTPALTTLDIEGNFSTQGHVKILVERSGIGRKVQTLRVAKANRRSIRNQDIQRMIRLFPALSELTLDAVDVDNWKVLWDGLAEQPETPDVGHPFSQLRELNVLQVKNSWPTDGMTFFEGMCRFLQKGQCKDCTVRTSFTLSSLAPTERDVRRAWKKVAVELGGEHMSPEEAGVRMVRLAVPKLGVNRGQVGRLLRS